MSSPGIVAAEAYTFRSLAFRALASPAADASMSPGLPLTPDHLAVGERNPCNAGFLDNPVELFPEFPMTELILGIPLDKPGAPRKQEFILTRNAEVLIGFLHRKREDGTCS